MNVEPFDYQPNYLLLESTKDALFTKLSSEGSSHNWSLPCAQTRVANDNRGIIYIAARPNGTVKRRAFREPCSAGHRPSSEARCEISSLTKPYGRFDVRAERERRHYTVSSSSWAVRGVVYATITYGATHAHCTNQQLILIIPYFF